MKALDKLQSIQEENKSMICLGLDLDIKRMPPDYTKNPKGMFDFAMKIVEATSDQVCAYKPNLAFYESFGTGGISILKMIIDRIPDNIPIIVDAKRGDIGNTASHYAEALFEVLNADWVTVNPYMGYDSLRPFLEYKDRGTFILCLTSNPGSRDFQVLKVDNKPLYEIVAEKVVYWNKSGNCGLVVGATAPEQLKEIRNIAEDMPLLIPGVGAQGGSLEEATINGTDRFSKTALINVSRSVLYAGSGENFADCAREELLKLNSKVTSIRNNSNHEDKVNLQANHQQEHKKTEKIIVREQANQQAPETQKTDKILNGVDPKATPVHHEEKDKPETAPENNNSHPQEPDHQSSDRAFENNHQNNNSTHAQDVQKLEPDAVAKENNYQHQKPEPARFEPQEQEPRFQSSQSDNKPDQSKRADEGEKNIEEEPRPMPKPVQRIIPPPILKPPPLPYSNKKIEPEDKQ
ncbi:MAG: orotidine-5'-phosphate decarboxylase [bacterium]